MARTDWQKTNYPGVRMKFHPTRKHGVSPDRYFLVQFRVNGKLYQSGCGWASEKWTAEKAARILAELKEAVRKGDGPATLKERQRIAQRQREKESRAGTTMSELWEDYARMKEPVLKPKSLRREEQLFRIWIAKRIGGKPVREVTENDVEAIMDDLRVAGKTPRTIQYAIGLMGRLWKLALRRGIVEAASPTARVEKPKVNNTRLRCFQPAELKEVLERLETRDSNARDLVLFAALTGCRFSEAAGLQWQFVDLIRESVTFPDTKNRDPREVFLPTELLELLESRGPGNVGGHVFTRSDGNPWKDIPGAFRAAVEDLGLNKGRGPRERLTFHSLRHSAATYAARRGLPVKDMQEIFGWKTPDMVLRYCKGSDDVKRRAARGLAASLIGGGELARVLPFPRQVAGGSDSE